MPEQPEDNSHNNIILAAELFIRRRWVILGTFCLTTFATIVVLLSLPNRYTSEATLFLVQQQVPERYVVSTTTSDISQALDAMAEEALSRPRLLSIIDQLGLYPKEKARLTNEELIKMARHDVSIEPLKNRLNAFKISFTADNPQLAQHVTRKLTTLFIEQNLKTREDQATITTNFLHEQLELAKNQLTEQEQRLRDYKMQYLGELPEQQQGNLGILTGLQTQLDSVLANRSQAQQQRLYLESLLSEHRRISRRPSTASVSKDGQVVTPLETAIHDLTRLQAERRVLVTVYTRQHPDVLKKDQEIEAQQTFVNSFKAANAAPTGDQERIGSVVPNIEDDASVSNVKSQLRANALEIENLTKKEQKLRADIDQYQSRLNLTPVREQQLTSMQRDYELLKQHYGDLLKKEQESQLAKNLEKRQEGQQFRLADPPNLPGLPSSPKRVKISLIALAVGLGLGCGFALLVEMRNPSFQTEDEVTSRLALPLVVGIPLIFTPAEERARSRGKMLEWFAGSVVALAVVMAELYVYRHG
jgi:polysaccharide biosynthesis transport protein